MAGAECMPLTRLTNARVSGGSIATFPAQHSDPLSAFFSEATYADCGAHHRPTTGLCAIASAPESDCGPGAARHPHADSDDAQPGQPLVHRHAEGLCALSSGSARFGVQPAARVSALQGERQTLSPATYPCVPSRVGIWQCWGCTASFLSDIRSRVRCLAFSDRNLAGMAGAP
jgi:hypothetical protein